MSAASDKAFIEFERAIDEALDACSQGVEAAAAVYDRDGAGEEVDLKALGVFKKATAEAQAVCDKAMKAAHAVYKEATATDQEAYCKGLVQHLKNAALSRERAMRLINESERSRLHAMREEGK